MGLPRLDDATFISDRLNLLASIVKTRSRASLTDANRILETIIARFFNALHGWNLINLNLEQANYAAVDLGDRQRRIAIQVTNEDSSDKIKRTTEKAIEHNLSADFDRVIVFFLIPKKPGLPKNFQQPAGGPRIEPWDIADLLQQLQDAPDLQALARAAAVLGDELGKLPESPKAPAVDISRILKYAPAQLIGRDDETRLLHDVWTKVQAQEPTRVHVLTFVALGGEGKTSLVAKWAVELAARDWSGCDAAFAWSFYSQGTREQSTASSDLFLKEALTFFGDDADKQFAAGSAGPFEKGQRLARIVGQRSSLLILDGLEPLQHSPTASTPGELKDQGIAALLKGLAAVSRGLCVITTRYSIPDLVAFHGRTVHEERLKRLSRAAGVRLLQSLGVRGSERRNLPSGKGKERVNEFEKLVEDVKGHALTLQIMGEFLKRAFHADIRCRDRVEFQKADEKIDGGHAFRAMDAYVKWMEGESDEAKRELAILRLMGLFDRPATRDCINSLLKPPAIVGLTEPIAGVAEEDFAFSLDALETANLLTINRDPSGALISLDAHPHLRAYFATRLRGTDFHPVAGRTRQSTASGQPGLKGHASTDAWREAHRRLCAHLCATVHEGDQPTLEALQPLYQAVAHGCQAGLWAEVFDNVYLRRIARGHEYYSLKKLGAVSDDLCALANFFDKCWDLAVPDLSLHQQGIVFKVTAACLEFAGRLTESIEALRSALAISKSLGSALGMSNCSVSLSGLQLVIGNLDQAVIEAENAVAYADQCRDLHSRVVARAGLADTLHNMGRREEAWFLFVEAEEIQRELSPGYPLLYSTNAFRLSDLLLCPCERWAWSSYRPEDPSELLGMCRQVQNRYSTLVAIRSQEDYRRNIETIMDVTLDHLTLGRAALYEAILADSERETARREMDAAVAGLRRAGTQIMLPLGLLSRAWLRFLTGQKTGPDSAQEDLDEAWEIAERGPMRLCLADIHLHRARLFFRESAYPWISPQADLAAAEHLINSCGYHRRDEELADAKRAILGTEDRCATS